MSKVCSGREVAALLATLVERDRHLAVVYRTTRGVPKAYGLFRRGQIGSASLISLAHATTRRRRWAWR